MKFSSMTMISIKLIPISVMLAVGGAHAATNEPVVTAASGVVVKANPKVAPGKVTPKATTGTVTGQGDERQYPAGTIPVPPKPRKDGIEAAGAIKAKAAQP